jgi:hypothetical protein
MDQISLKTPNPKCRLYWCLIEFYRLEIQSVMLVFSNTSSPLTASNLLPGSLTPPPPPPVWISTVVCIHAVYNREGGIWGLRQIQTPAAQYLS